MIGAGRRIDREFLNELEDRLLAADIGVAKTDEILTSCKSAIRLARWLLVKSCWIC